MAQNRSALRWLEWDRHFFPAFGTGRPRFLMRPGGFAVWLYLALLAVLRIVLEALIREERRTPVRLRQKQTRLCIRCT